MILTVEMVILMPWPGVRDVAWLVAMPKVKLVNEMFAKEAKVLVAEPSRSPRDAEDRCGE